MNEQLRKLIEEIDDIDETPGDVSNFQAPTKEEWEYADEDSLYSESYGIDLAADLLLDNEPQYLGSLFTDLGELFRVSEGNRTLGTDVLQAVRQFTHTINITLQGEDGMIMRPENDTEILRSLKYAFDNIIKRVKRDVKI